MSLEPNKATVALFLGRWLAHIKTQVSPKSHERYSGIVNQNLIPAIGAVRLNKLKPSRYPQPTLPRSKVAGVTVAAASLPGPLGTCTALDGSRPTARIKTRKWGFRSGQQEMELADCKLKVNQRQGAIYV